MAKQPNRKRPKVDAPTKEAAKIADQAANELAQIAQQVEQDAHRAGGLGQFEAELITGDASDEQAEIIGQPPETADHDATGLTARRTSDQVAKLPDQLAKNVDLDVKALIEPKKSKKKK